MRALRLFAFRLADASLLVLALPAQAPGQGVEPGEVRPELPAPAPEPEEDPRKLRPPPLAPSGDVAPLEVELVVDVARFEISGSTVFDDEELAEVVAPWTGRANSTEELLAARDALSDFYVDHGYVTSGATLPDQDLAGGVVRLEIVEGAISEVDVSGNRRFRSRYFESRLARVSAAPVNVPEVEDALQGTLGLSLASLDALPASAILNLLHPEDGLATERVASVATLLETLASLEGGPRADARLAKAAALRSQLPTPHIDP